MWLKCRNASALTDDTQTVTVTTKEKKSNDPIIREVRRIMYVYMEGIIEWCLMFDVGIF